MCKHVAAVLYGVGTRLDAQPELLFTLRRVDAKDLVTQAGAGLPRPKKATKASKVLDDSALGDVFGIEMVESLPVKPKPRNKATAKKSEPSKLATGKAKVPAKKTAQDASKVPVKKPAKVSAKSPVKASAPARAPGGKAPVQAKTKPVKPKGVLKRTT